MNQTQLITFPISLNRKMRDLATTFSQFHQNSHKARQVYLNTLAVLAVDFYCQCMDIETQLNQSNSWDRTMQSLMDVADLIIDKTGQLECRPVLAGETICYIPTEVWSDRIGYLIVEIAEDTNKAIVLGYLPEVNQEHISLDQLHSLSEFLTHLEELQTEGSLVTVGDMVKNAVETVENTFTDLKQWFNGSFDNGWQSEEMALTRGLTASFQVVRAIEPANPDINQPEANGGKVIPLGIPMPQEAVVLILRQKYLSQGEIQVNLRLYPTGDAIYLPDGIHLTVLDETGNPIPQLQVEARADNWVQLQFTAEQGEKFSVNVTLGESTFIENFLL